MSKLILPLKSRIVLPSKKIIAPFRRPIRKFAHGTLTYEEEVLSDNPILYWKMNDTGGGATDSSSSGTNTGTYTNPLTKGQPAIVLNGGTTVSGSGSSTSKLQSDSGSVGVGSGAYTIEWWFKPSTPTLSPNNGIGDSRAVSSVAFLSQYISGGSLRITFNAVLIWDSITTPAIPAGTLEVGSIYHLVVTYDGTNARMYNNGSLLVGPTAAGTISWQRLLIGTTSRRWDGTYGHVALYTSALTAERVLAHYDAGAGA